MGNNTHTQIDSTLISYCGFHCGSCPGFANKECGGCKGDSPKCSFVYEACKVRKCCISNGYNTCAACDKYISAKDCENYKPD